jgi:hypothetical protein
MCPLERASLLQISISPRQEQSGSTINSKRLDPSRGNPKENPKELRRALREEAARGRAIQGERFRANRQLEENGKLK